MKRPMMESLFNKIVALKVCNFIKKVDSSTGDFLWNLPNFINTYFEQCLRTTAPDTPRGVIELLKDFVFQWMFTNFFTFPALGSISW